MRVDGIWMYVILLVRVSALTDAWVVIPSFAQRIWCGISLPLSLRTFIILDAVNIHTHLGGAVLFLWILGTFRPQYFTRYVSTTWLDTAVFVIFLLSAVACLSFSAFFHTCAAHSKEVRPNDTS